MDDSYYKNKETSIREMILKLGNITYEDGTKETRK